jgi:hypothetical protein
MDSGTYQKFLSVLNTVSWTTKLKGNYLNGIGCTIKFPAICGLCRVVPKQGILKGNNPT